MRSLLFVPADSERKLAKALTSNADALILDLEDSVAEPAKPRARALARDVLAAPRDRPHRHRMIVRINALDTPHWRDDIEAIAATSPDAVMLPKPSGGGDVTRLSEAIDVIEARNGLTTGAIRIIAIATETPASLLAMNSYIGCSPRLAGLAWGVEDLSAALGATRARDEHGLLGSPFRLARDLCLVAAAAAGVDAIDEIHADFHDPVGLMKAARQAARDGFTAKLAIHPDQVGPINLAFTPSAEEIAEAKAVVSAFQHARDAGVVSLGNRMLDRPHLVRAQRILARAGAARH
jgi:citrate lyase subunit beta/citryl-CoA lyase